MSLKVPLLVTNMARLFIENQQLSMHASLFSCHQHCLRQKQGPVQLVTKVIAVGTMNIQRARTKTGYYSSVFHCKILSKRSVYLNVKRQAIFYTTISETTEYCHTFRHRHLHSLTTEYQMQTTLEDSFRKYLITGE